MQGGTLKTDPNKRNTLMNFCPSVSKRVALFSLMIENMPVNYELSLNENFSKAFRKLVLN